jgi:mono/diheme cytochrome c family protein
MNVKTSIAALGLFALAAAHASVSAWQAAGSRTVWDGVYSEQQSTRGKALYVESCAQCHAADLSGGDSAPALSGVSFNANWTDLTLGDLSERIRVSMPADKPGTLSRQQVADLVSFVLSTGAFPTGAAELPVDLEALKQIKFLASKP